MNIIIKRSLLFALSIGIALTNLFATFHNDQIFENEIRTIIFREAQQRAKAKKNYRQSGNFKQQQKIFETSISRVKKDLPGKIACIEEAITHETNTILNATQLTDDQKAEQNIYINKKIASYLHSWSILALNSLCMNY